MHNNQPKLLVTAIRSQLFVTVMTAGLTMTVSHQAAAQNTLAEPPILSGQNSAQNLSTPSTTLTPIVVTAKTYEGYAAYTPTSGTKTDTEWLDVPQSVSVVTKTELEDRGAVRLLDAVKGVAGLNNTLGEGSRDEFVLRGFNGLNDVYSDGMRDDGKLQSYRSLANVERIEVVKGPAGALYGRGSAGGIINLVSKKAEGDDFDKVQAQVGSDGLVVTRIDSSHKVSDTVNARINAEYRRSDSYVDHVDSNDVFIAPTVRWQPNDQQTLDVSIDFMRQHLVPYRGVPSKNGKPVDVPVNTFYGGTNDYQDSDTWNAKVNHEFDINDNMTWTNRASYSHISLEQKGTRQSSADIINDKVEQTVNNFGYDPRTSKTLQSELAWNLGNHELLFGADYNDIDIDLTLATDKNIPSKSVSNPAQGPTADPGFPAFRKNSTQSTGIFAQDVYHIGDWSLVGNVRYDNMRLNQSFKGKDIELNEDKFSYRTGVVYNFNDATSAYATMARSWQLPYSGIFINPKLAALYQTDLKEIGVKTYLNDDSIMLNAALYRIDKEDPKTNKNREVTDKDEFRHQGIELEARGKLRDNWDVSAGYSYLDAEDKKTGLTPNDVPEQTFSLWTAYQPSEQWRVGGGVNYVSDRYAGDAEAVELDGYTTIDLMTAYSMGKHNLQLNLNNALDKEYALGATNGTSGKNQIGLGAPRTWLLTYNYEF
ncbi:iron complex outermembrane receptor protein/catecholate siderophore receptor [Psychrobacter sp. PL19]|uniref:TonB-dependent receptor n=1 Tax=Psychrobacter sp. PL19 TaxID=2760711 RepID=UPI002FF2EB3D